MSTFAADVCSRAPVATRRRRGGQAAPPPHKGYTYAHKSAKEINANPPTLAAEQRRQQGGSKADKPPSCRHAAATAKSGIRQLACKQSSRRDFLSPNGQISPRPPCGAGGSSPFDIAALWRGTSRLPRTRLPPKGGAHARKRAEGINVFSLSSEAAIIRRNTIIVVLLSQAIITIIVH